VRPARPDDGQTCERLLAVTFFVTDATQSCPRHPEHLPGCATISTVDHDPVLERRRRIAGLVRVGQRAGYGLFGLAMALFVVGLFAGFGGAVGGGIVAAIVVGSIVLAPAIVFGYAVRAAEREDREQGRPTLD
jgi:hypothetical protein